MKSTDGTMNIVWSSDHHLLHPRTPTKHILNNLSTFFYKDVDLAKVDLIIFGGDLYHRLVEASNKEFILVSKWIRKFLQKCKEFDVIVRILEGTSSHDWEQPEHFELVKPTKSNVKYIKEITIEHIPELDLNMLYVPDNLGSLSTDKIWEMVVDKLVESNLQHVDLTAFHGAFKYQLPEHISKHTHLESNYESITTYGIFSGHIHTPSHKGKIYVSGSFDRTAHGEEHPKGAYRIVLNKKTGLFIPEFYVNKNSLPYITIKITPETTVLELTQQLEKIVDKRLPLGSQLRIRGGEASVVNSVMTEFTKQYPHYGITIENAVQGAVVDDTLYDTGVYQGIVINKDNITNLLFSDSFTENLSELDVKEMKEIFNEHLNC